MLNLRGRSRVGRRGGRGLLGDVRHTDGTPAGKSRGWKWQSFTTGIITIIVILIAKNHQQIQVDFGILLHNVFKTIVNHPFGNGNHTTYKNGDLGDGLLLF